MHSVLSLFGEEFWGHGSQELLKGLKIEFGSLQIQVDPSKFGADPLGQGWQNPLEFLKCPGAQIQPFWDHN